MDEHERPVEWGGGSEDSTLYRSNADLLTTDDELHGWRLAWAYVCYYANPRVFLSRLARTEWDERWGSWPHCNGQAGCWMHVSARWCGCRCRWCRVARAIRRDGQGRRGPDGRLLIGGQESDRGR